MYVTHSIKEKYYLKFGRAEDPEMFLDKVLYRFFEILPSALAWITLIGIILASKKPPVAASVYIIAFDFYWLIKTVFLSVHLRASYAQMKKNIAADWIGLLKKIPKDQYQIKTENWSDIY